MDIQSRFKEKTTYFIMLGFIILAFIISVSLCIFLYYQTLDFWKYATFCMVDKNFDCLLDSLSHQSLINAKISTFITCIVSINGIIASLVFLMLFKQKG
ncbi:hypothetical protein LS68_008145 [Helicobacter sp. MIT 05-5293]|uniref:hypothetical protein n=1 Tax=Helicobacter sp. MIT 05-5293 TaxID=1548149 RepID=UPI00051D78B6|nr:hypothetical protein [Helicobacter sp. MIT 05-5293]TLD80179.1 hypothetical protein LS68_008145 [Helicobacter sp. MIT 05-5293]